ncbi:hypothetical protein [Flavivirga algicola]|uniref:Uncharacterized protein n=1 Tax=Flavivirga algicola TaxID=2729136 RepID=A0ABX1RTT0_9FLAO|nr:hypothetical protein [Flavivirga algicola]NMH85914.1 hypothetical protein [Flavivirga algicola]
MQKILTIEKIINMGNKRGLIFLPMIPISFFNSHEIPEYAELRLPNGSFEKRKIIFTIPRLKSKEEEIQYLIMLKSGRQEDFSPGTEIWCELTKTAN